VSGWVACQLAFIIIYVSSSFWYCLILQPSDPRATLTLWRTHAQGFSLGIVVDLLRRIDGRNAAASSTRRQREACRLLIMLTTTIHTQCVCVYFSMRLSRYIIKEKHGAYLRQSVAVEIHHHNEPATIPSSMPLVIEHLEVREPGEHIFTPDDDDDIIASPVIN